MAESQPPESQSLETAFSDSWFEFTRVLHKRFSTIRTFTLVTALVVVLGTWLQVPAYQATASVLIDSETPNVLTVSSTWDGGSSPGSRADIGQVSYMTYADYYRTQMEVMASRSIAEKVFANLQLGQRPEFAGEKDPVALLLSKVIVEPVKQTRLATISAEDKDPRQAARIANEFALVFTLENLNKTSITESMILKKNEYLKLQAKEAELSKRYKNRHPALVRTRKEMEQLAEYIGEGARRQMAGPEPAQTQNAGEGSDPAASLQDRLKQSSMSRSLRPNNIRVQDLAQPPEQPIRPKRMLSLLLGLLMGGLTGLGVAVGQEMLDTSLKTPEEVEAGGKMILLGYVPRIEGLQGSSGAEFEKHCQFIDAESFSPAVEAYRSIRTALMYAAPVVKGNAILFTSPGPEEGKTTTVCNLSVAIARSGEKTLLVDADLRKGRVHEVFGLPQGPGLSEFLTGQAVFEEIVRKTEIPNLSIVTCGVYPPFPAELVGSSQMQVFLDKSTGKYDRVLVDSPPTLAVTDPVVLAATIKVVVAIAQSGKTPRQALYRLAKTCTDVRAKLLGVILNNVPVWSSPYYYRYSSYGYSSRQKSGSDSFKPLSPSP